MSDREKVINGLHCHANWEQGYGCKKCRYLESGGGCSEALAMDALALLKEQEHKDKMYHALEEDWKRIKELLKEQEAVVRCKDCIYKEENPSPYWKYWCNRLKCGCDDDWFCADGERRTDDA